MIHRPFSTAFIDLLMGTVIILMLLMNPPTQDLAAKPTAQYTMYVSWSPDINTDIDVYLLYPGGKKAVWYQAKDTGSAHLDRDDLGKNQGAMNLEIVSMDVMPDGIYYVSVHTYAGYPGAGYTVTVDILNDKGKSVFSRSVPMPFLKEEAGIAELIFKDGKLWAQSYSEIHIRNAGLLPEGTPMNEF